MGSHYAIINPLKLIYDLITQNISNQINITHIFKCENTDEIVIVPVLDLVTTCFHVSNNTDNYVIQPVIEYEYE